MPPIFQDDSRHQETLRGLHDQLTRAGYEFERGERMRHFYRKGEERAVINEYGSGGHTLTFLGKRAKDAVSEATAAEVAKGFAYGGSDINSSTARVRTAELRRLQALTAGTSMAVYVAALSPRDIGDKWARVSTKALRTLGIVAERIRPDTATDELSPVSLDPATAAHNAGLTEAQDVVGEPMTLEALKKFGRERAQAVESLARQQPRFALLRGKANQLNGELQRSITTAKAEAIVERLVGLARQSGAVEDELLPVSVGDAQDTEKQELARKLKAARHELNMAQRDGSNHNFQRVCAERVKRLEQEYATAKDELPLPVKTSNLVPLPSGERNQESYAPRPVGDETPSTVYKMADGSKKTARELLKVGWLVDNGGGFYEIPKHFEGKFAPEVTGPVEDDAYADTAKEAMNKYGSTWQYAARHVFQKLGEAAALKFAREEGPAGGVATVRNHIKNGWQEMAKDRRRASDSIIAPDAHLADAVLREIAGDRAHALDAYRAAASGFRRAGDAANLAKANDGVAACQAYVAAGYTHPSAGRVKVCDSRDAALRTAVERTRAGEHVCVHGTTVRPGMRAHGSDAEPLKRFEATIKMPVKYAVLGSQKEEVVIAPVQIEGWNGKVGGVFIPRTTLLSKITGKDVGSVTSPNMDLAQKYYDRTKAKDTAGVSARLFKDEAAARQFYWRLMNESAPKGPIALTEGPDGWEVSWRPGLGFDDAGGPPPVDEPSEPAMPSPVPVGDEGEACPACSGSGRNGANPCEKCNGSGWKDPKKQGKQVKDGAKLLPSHPAVKEALRIITRKAPKLPVTAVEVAEFYSALGEDKTPNYIADWFIHDNRRKMKDSALSSRRLNVPSGVLLRTTAGSLASVIGRKKYGAKGMAAKSAAGRAKDTDMSASARLVATRAKVPADEATNALQAVGWGRWKSDFQPQQAVEAAVEFLANHAKDLQPVPVDRRVDPYKKDMERKREEEKKSTKDASLHAYVPDKDGTCAVCGAAASDPKQHKDAAQWTSSGKAKDASLAGLHKLSVAQLEKALDQTEDELADAKEHEDSAQVSEIEKEVRDLERALASKKRTKDEELMPV